MFFLRQLTTSTSVRELHIKKICFSLLIPYQLLRPARSHSIPRGANNHFLKHLHRPYSTNKRLHLAFFKFWDQHFFFIPRGMIPRRVSFSDLQFELLGETKILNILTRWSVPQAGSNDEKNWRQKISLDCPFNTCFSTNSVEGRSECSHVANLGTGGHYGRHTVKSSLVFTVFILPKQPGILNRKSEL